MTIELNEHELRIHDYVSVDPVVLAAFRAAADAGREPDNYIDTVLGLGAQVASLASNTVGAEKLEASISQAQNAIGTITDQLSVSIKQQVTAFSSEDGALVRAFSGIIEEFRSEIDELTSDENSPMRTAIMASLADAQKRIEANAAQAAEKQQAVLARMLDPLDPQSPLRTITERLDGVGRAIAEVKETQTKELARVEALEGGIFGGMEYEDIVVKSIQAIAAFAGDDCEPTGNSIGRVPRNKMGDAIIDLKVGSAVYGRMVMEAKNKKLTKKDWEAERDGSLENRAATGFIGLCKHLVDMPTGNRIVIMNSKSMVLAFDPEYDDKELLFLVYHLVRIATLNESGTLDEISAGEVNHYLAETIKALQSFDSITRSAASIRNLADKIYEEAKELRAMINTNLVAAQTALTPHIEPAALIEGHSFVNGERPELTL